MEHKCRCKSGQDALQSVSKIQVCQLTSKFKRKFLLSQRMVTNITLKKCRNNADCTWTPSKVIFFCGF